MQKEPRNITPFHIGGAIMVLIFIILLIITLVQMFAPNPYGKGLRIDNLSDYVKNLPTDRADSMFATLYKTVELNMASDAKVPTSGALIRDGSVNENYNKDTNVYSGNFIVDIEKIRHSYQVQYEWSRNNTNPNLSGYQVIVSCLPKELVVYDDFECKDMFSAGDFDPYDAISLYLPYYGKVESGESTYVQRRSYLSGGQYLEISVNSCGNSSITEQAQRSTEAWIKSIGLKVENFVLEVRSLCDGSA